jgi:membrane protease subunit HflC
MVAVVVALILVFSAITFRVRFGEVAVLTTFDRPIRSITEPGLYFKFPFPIQRVHRFDARLQVFDGRIEQTYTKDAKNIVVLGTTAWRVKDPLRFLQTVGNFADAKRNLEGLTRGYKHAVIGRHPLSSLISADEEKMRFDEIEQEILLSVSKEALEKYGIEVGFFKIKRLLLPEAVTAKVFARMREERGRIAEGHRAGGTAEAMRIRARADAERERIIAQAESQARIIKGKAAAEAAKYYDVFRENQDLAIFLKNLEALEQTLKGKSTIVIDTGTPPFDLLEGIREKGQTGE